ncbi:MAG TPA: hypothetical protein VFV34_17115 [Blastocatellia bacterium]|nr:hypothetical protein [Blastocatellia bacterium]
MSTPPYGAPPGGYQGGGFQGGGYPPPPGGYQGGYPPPRRSNTVGQVKVVAILMIVQGSLVCLVGLLLLIMGPAMFALSGSSEFSTESDRIGATVAGAVYMVLGALILIVGGLNILAGVKNLKYRGRTLGLAAISIGLIAMFTCYCSITAIGLFIYGLIVYMNQDVRRAFEMGEQGATPDQIMNSI